MTDTVPYQFVDYNKQGSSGGCWGGDWISDLGRRERPGFDALLLARGRQVTTQHVKLINIITLLLNLLFFVQFFEHSTLD